jgi:ketosteroid isomerase-like protein
MSTATPEQVLESIVTGINSGNLESLMPLYESEAAFATQPGSLAHGAPGVREALTGFISMKGRLDLEVTRVLEVGDLSLVIGVWSFNGTGPDGEPCGWRQGTRMSCVVRETVPGASSSTTRGEPTEQPSGERARPATQGPLRWSRIERGRSLRSVDPGRRRATLGLLALAFDAGPVGVLSPRPLLRSALTWSRGARRRPRRPALFGVFADACPPPHVPGPVRARARRRLPASVCCCSNGWNESRDQDDPAWRCRPERRERGPVRSSHLRGGCRAPCGGVRKDGS